MKRPRYSSPFGRRRGVPPIALVGAAVVGFAGAFGLLSQDRPAGERSAFLDDSRAVTRAAAAPAAECNIKGNISVKNGERIYHVPGQEYYSETQISPGKGERYFCSEAEARAAGWRRSKV